MKDKPQLQRGWALLCLLAAPFWTPAQETSLPRVTLHMGFTPSSFRNVSATDATAAFRVFAQTAARKRGYALDVDSRLFDSAAACEAEIKKGVINMAILDTWDYLGMDIQSVMAPVFVHLEQGTVFKNYLLLVRRGSGVTCLADLRGKDLKVLEGKGGSISLAWLDRLLRAQNLGTEETFFRRLEPAAKSTAAVLPVFFGAKPACLVDRATFEIMSELNPQVSSNLVVMAVSEPYLENITCLSRSGWPSEQARQAVLQGLAELHLEPSGRQILELFKLDQMVPFKEAYLESARKLRADCETAGGKGVATLPSGPTGSHP